MSVVDCQQCGAAMEKGKKVDRSMTLQLLGVVVFVVGLGLAFIYPLGTVVGIVLMIVAARMGYSQRKVWKCPNCGYFFERV